VTDLPPATRDTIAAGSPPPELPAAISSSSTAHPRYRPMHCPDPVGPPAALVPAEELADDEVIRESTRQLGVVLAEIAAGELECSAGTRNRLEGARLALVAATTVVTTTS
jgi:hypothetical protein